MNFAQEPEGWADLSREEKNRVLYERQLALLDTFLEKARSPAPSMKRAAMT